jgi:hypothetical protein
VVPHHDDVRRTGAAGLVEDVEEPPDEPVDVLKRPVRLGAGRAVVVLEAVGDQEVQQQEVGRAPVQQPGRRRE